VQKRKGHTPKKTSINSAVKYPVKFTALRGKQAKKMQLKKACALNASKPLRPREGLSYLFDENLTR
jgi:hypothetical protein